MVHPKASDEQVLNYDLGIEDTIEKFIPREGYPSALHEPIWDLLDRGGKRFRPVLTYLCCKMVGGNTKQINQLAAAVELLHNMTLVHDDIGLFGKHFALHDFFYQLFPLTETGPSFHPPIG